MALVEVEDFAWQVYEVLPCTTADPRIFFAEDTWRKGSGEHAKAEAQAKLICSSCPSKLDCLAMAIRQDIGYGIWGGYTPDERMKLRRGEPVTPI